MLDMHVVADGNPHPGAGWQAHSVQVRVPSHTLHRLNAAVTVCRV